MLNKKELDIRRQESLLVAIRYTHVDILGISVVTSCFAIVIAS